MTVSKDMSRPTSQHRLSLGSTASSLPVRSSYSRSHSHTFSAGSTVPASRINRRKSSTFSPAANATALAAVEHAVAAGSLPVNRRSSASKAALASLNDAAYPPIPSSLPHHISLPESSSSAVVDGPALSSFQGVDKTKNRARRASDGTRLTKKEKAASGELKCEHCGKAYKHGSCLNKHLWEHTPQWQVTSKLLISKHQQVQLLEAASVLMDMTAKGNPANDSDNSSSPAASGSSERDDDLSSAETTPPPQADHAYREQKRYSNNSSAYSRSYQSVFSESAPADNHGFAHYRQWSTSSVNRPQTAATSIADSYKDEDPADMAAAMGLLSCRSGNTPKSGPVHLGNDIPPVPPLPEKYANHFSSYRNQNGDVIMDGDDSDDGRTSRRPVHIYDDDEYMFGRMEMAS